MEERVLELKEQQAQHRDKPNYLLVFAGLAVLTGIELGLSMLHTIWTIPILVAMSAAKIVLVAMFYMHLKTDSRWYAYLFLVPIPFVALIATALIIGV